MVLLIHSDSSLGQRSPAEGGDGVDPAAAAGDVFQRRFQKTAAFHSVQQRIERSRADTVPVTIQLLHHGEAEDGLMQGVHEHMNADEAREQVAML